MKILFILQSPTFSGAENVACQIVDMFRNDPNLDFYYSSPDGPIREALLERKVKFVPLNSFTVKGIKRAIKEVNPDYVHSHDMRASLLSALACGKRKLIVHVHNNHFDNRCINIRTLGFLLPALKAKHIFWVSNSSFTGYIFHKFFSSKSSVLYNVIDEDLLRARMSSDKSHYDYDVIYIGRLTYQKDPIRLMNIMSSLVAKKPDIKIAVIGTGDMQEEVRELRDNLRLQDNVNMLGYIANPLKILHDSKVMVMSSRWEGTPMCALESLSLGVPIVSTPTDGMADIIENGKNGFLFSEDDNIVDSILDIVDNKSTIVKLSKGATETSASINNKENYRRAISASYL